MNPLTADDPRAIGGFRLHARLGAGGMGRVYLGFSAAGRAVAVKVIHPHLARDEAFAARFRREVAAAQAVNAVYATPVIAAGPDDDPPWLATAFVPAPSLRDVVTVAGALPEEAVWKLAAGLAEALRAIHASGLVHRDLKPANVLLAADGPRVIDFGIARVLDGTRMTATESVLGTPSFMSPEQAEGMRAGPASDVFSLGGVTYFAATGRTPFGDGIPAALMYRIVHTEPVLDGLPPRLRSLIVACMIKDPAPRPTPTQLAAALMPAMPSESSLAASWPSFWPAPVAQFIRDYQARLDADESDPGAVAATGGLPAAGGVPATGGFPAAGSFPATGGSPATGGGAETWRGSPADERQAAGRHARRPEAATGMGRRRALAALAGMATAGLGVAGWELARGSTPGAGAGKLTASQSLGKPVPPGTRIWRFKANAAVGAVTVAGRTLYAGTGGNTVFALDAATGGQIWRRATTSQLNNVLLVAGGSLVVAGDTGLYALAADSGRLLWSVGTDSGTGLAAAGDVVYAGIAPKNPTTGGVTALNASTGQLLWTYPFGPVADIAGGLAVTGGVVYTTTTDGEIFALSAADGSRRGRVSGSFVKFGAAPVVVADGTIYAVGDNSAATIFAVGAGTGRTVWRQDLGPSSSPAYLAAASGVLFAGLLRNPQSAGPDAGGLYALNGATGQQLWSVPVPGGVNLSPVVAGSAVYTGSEDGVLDAWQASTGNKLWSYSAPDTIGSNVAAAGPRVYFGTGNYVYAVEG